jgi:hypothetical protein
VKYSTKKPGAKNVLMILVAILLVGGAFTYAEYSNKEAETVYSKPDIEIGTSTSQSYQNSQDSTDWKRILLATDTVASSSVNDLTKKPAPLTPADLLARDFFARYMELKQTGDTADEASRQELINKVLQNGTLVATPKVYSHGDIKTKVDSSTESLKTYYNQLGTVVKTYSIQYRNEAIIAKEAFDKADMSILKELDPIIKNNKAQLDAFLKIVVPQTVVKTHLDLVNTMSSIVYMDEGFRNSANDPFAGIQSTSLVLKNNDSLVLILKSIQNTIFSNDITFTPSENGSLFTKL